MRTPKLVITIISIIIFVPVTSSLAGNSKSPCEIWKNVKNEINLPDLPFTNENQNTRVTSVAWKKMLNSLNELQAKKLSYIMSLFWVNLRKGGDLEGAEFSPAKDIIDSQKKGFHAYSFQSVHQLVSGVRSEMQGIMSENGGDFDKALPVMENKITRFIDVAAFVNAYSDFISTKNTTKVIEEINKVDNDEINLLTRQYCK